MPEIEVRVGVIKGFAGVSSEYCCFEIGDKKMSSEESKTKVEVISIPSGALPAVIPREEFASRVLDAVRDGILGKIMKNAVSDALDAVLRKEIVKLADEVMRFRKMLSEKMLADQSISFEDPVCLEKLPEGIEDGWEAWKSSWDNRDELAYRAFIKQIVKSPPPPPESEE